MNKVLKVLFFAVGLLFIFPQHIFSQQLGFTGFADRKMPFKQNVIKTNLIPVFVGQIPLCGELRFTYERMLTHNQSLTLGLSYNFPSLLLFILPAISNPNRVGIKDFSIRGGRVTAGYRFYPLKKRQAPKGLFVGPYGSFNFAKMKPRHGNGSYDLICYADAGVIAGYQIHMSRGVFMEFFGGLGYRKNYVVSYDARYNETTKQDFYLFHGTPLSPVDNLKIFLQLNFGFGW